MMDELWADLARLASETSPIDVGSTPYPCPYCDKAFGRSDVRAKHVQTMHDREMEDGSSQSETPPAKMRRVDGPISPAGSTSALQQSAPPPRSASINMPWPGEASNYGAAEQTLFAPPTPQSAMLNGQNGLMLPPNTSNFPIQPSPPGFLDPSSLSTGSSSLPLDPGPMISGITGIDPFAAWDSFGHVFGWGLETDIDYDVGLQNSMYDYSEIGPVTSTENLSAAWLLAATPRGGSPVDGDVERKRDPFGRTHDTPWPHMFKPKVPDKPLTLGGVKASPRPNRSRNGPEPISPISRNAMLSLIYLSHQTLWLMPDIDDFPDHETLSDFVDLYFEKFHPTFPILHRATFVRAETPPMLLLATAAIGATFADKEFKPISAALCELVRRMVQWMRASDQRSKFDIDALIAYTLVTLLGLSCGSRELFLHSEISRCSLNTSRRRLHWLRTNRDDSFKGGNSVEDRWQVFIEEEGRKRVGWGIFLLDLQMAMLLGMAPISTVSEATVQLPCDEALWEAPDAVSWAALDKAQKPAPTVPKFFNAALAGKMEIGLLSDFSRSIVSYSIHQYLLDAYSLNRLLVSDDLEEEPTITNYVPAILGARPMAILLDLARTSFPLDQPSHLRLSSAALYHHSHMQLTRPGLLEHIRAASGKHEPDMKQETSIEWLQNWMKQGKEVRRVVWHAGVLNALMSEFPRGAFPELFWMFDCALVFWAVVKYGLDSLKSSELRSALFAANWFDTDPPQVWLEHGGQIVFPYLGSSSTMNVKDTLTLFMNRIDSMPWGLATQFRQVLAKLLDAEGQA
ncbi:fungal-specific transcription factor domain-domain-containing protein [Naematelia encephala]|uniref:Fungal-specific transcription factor domain-domain-containing protein n=1 Tax=Naematelia encephala TaxID=71784 RepID=A0A1Y2ASW1_9TREE|nr:fungal-specific transcription factor domain-domain-containing protein [Naematelia encephala]